MRSDQLVSVKIQLAILLASIYRRQNRMLLETNSKQLIFWYLWGKHQQVIYKHIRNKKEWSLMKLGKNWHKVWNLLNNSSIVLEVFVC